MAAREQMERIKLEEVNLKGIKSTKDQSKTCVLIQSFIKKLTLLVKQYFFHACNKSDHLCPEAAIILHLFISALPWQCDIMEYSSIHG